jgi:hypothetical protein
VEALLELITALTPAQWVLVMERASALGPELTREDIIRGAVVAIAVRHLLRPDQFDLLFMPFAEAIPSASLERRTRSQN